MEPTLYVYDGAQYPADRLPEGVNVKDLQTVDEWFAENKVSPQHKAILEPKPPRSKTK